MSKTLYLCYFGLREPLVQTQVLPYLREINKMENMKVSLLTFEPNFRKNWTKEAIEIERKKLAAENIEWRALGYHKRPSVPATLYDILCGFWFTRRALAREKIDILHARVHVPGIFGLLARGLSRQKPKLLFDIRGFVPEEYTDAGVWKENGLIYKVFKRIERWIMKNSDGFVVLTGSARRTLFPESLESGFDKFDRPIEVIPCSVDFEKRFDFDYEKVRAETRDELNLKDRLVITHLGALGGLYLTEHIADFLAVARRENAQVFAMFLTQTGTEKIIPLLKARGFTDDDFFAGKVLPAEVPRYLCAADVALSFVKATYATISRSPTKIPEYLACGLPVVSNRGVGDVDELILTDKVGVLIDDFSEASYSKALAEVLKSKASGAITVEKCRDSARKRFDLETVGGARYRSLYKRLMAK
jgi:glycosyltransferase involved in cell wall biosynthesis